MASDRLGLLVEIYRESAGCVRQELRRHVPAERLAAYAAVFFRDVEPLPRGPGMAGAIELFLARLAGMATSETPGVRYVYAALERQGLTGHARRRIAEMARAARLETERPASDLFP